MGALTILLAAGLGQAVEVKRLPAAEANQGVAADATSVYAVDNSRIGRYDKVSGRRVAAWTGDPARYKHLNSCIVRRRELVCVASNYPETPMRSEILWFDAPTLKLKRTRALPYSEGSLTWLDWHRGGWWAGFANYDGKGGVAGRDHRSTVVVRYSPAFAPQATYRFPAPVLERFAPRSTSGGAWNRDGLLYVTGHDRPELYAMQAPARGTVLRHVATISTPTGGQAIAWDPHDPRRLWSIDRRTHEIVASRIRR
jgi:hypothetical protein